MPKILQGVRPSLSIHRIPLKEEPFKGTNLCRLYDEHARLYMMPVYRHFARKIASMKLKNPRILDLGTGSGLLSIEIAKILNQDFQITATDISEDMLEIAQYNINISGLGHKIEVKACSASALSFPNQSFDCVVSNASLHHWINPLAAFNEIARVTQRGGVCLIRDNMRLSPLWNPLINLISYTKGMNQMQHDLWVKAIRASYTLPELKALLKQSDWKNYSISINPTFLDLTIRCLF
jgi:ubiquinone/menaquinone biosynthesis C-methylase UbiE